MRDRPLYTLVFATAVCAVCALAVSTFAVRLSPRIESNRALDRQKRVLAAAGLMTPDQDTSARAVRSLFDARIATKIVALGSRVLLAPNADTAVLLARDAEAPANEAGLVRVPTHVKVYFLTGDDGAAVIVLPVEGKGLWSTIRGYLALEVGTAGIVRGLEFYAHGETPGLGGEIDNPRWKAQWKGRHAFDETGGVALHVARTKVGPPSEYPYGVDALSGATITARGVTALMQYWLADHGYGPLLRALAQDAEGP